MPYWLNAKKSWAGLALKIQLELLYSVPSLLSESLILDALKSVKYPGFSRDIVSFGLIKKITITQGTVSVIIAVNTSDEKIAQILHTESTARLRALEGVRSTQVEVRLAPTSHVTPGAGAAGLPQEPIAGIRKIIAVGSGKGGVGKSTVAANLALALLKQGEAVGLCDCDIYGPSMALMFGTNESPYGTEDNRLIPIERYGLRLMSMGFLLAEDAPAILRGPMVTRYTQQFLRNVEWGQLDTLILDLPPGTGDIQLTIVQTVALTGAIVVSTPQEVALIDARKAAAMFAKVNVPVLGLIENMSYFLCPSDQIRYNIFGSGGGLREAERLGVPLLAQIPIEIGVRESGDRGLPIVLAEPESIASIEFFKAATKISSL